MVMSPLQFRSSVAAICRTACLALLLAAVLPISGCSDGQASFKNRETFDELAPFARDYLGEKLDSHFGTPTQPIVWEDLPLRLHAADARVVESTSGSAGLKTLTVTLSDENLQIEPGMEVMFLSGARLGEETGWIQEYDAETGVVTFETELAGPAPAEGDRIVFGPGAIIQRGRMLYAEHCQHCHGVSGDGNGPTAQYLNPLPRDYRMGLFKFTSTAQPARASRTDLARIVENGIPGTYMPSFKLLEPEEMSNIIEYVLYLSMRGELEWRMTQFLATDYSQEVVSERIADGETRSEIEDGFAEATADEGEIAEEWTLRVELITDSWLAAQEESSTIFPREPRVAATPESIARGRLIYLGADAKCATCHGESGLGDGPQTLAVQTTADPNTGVLPTEPGLFDSWGHEIKPRNLRTNIYRGGRRPLDLYRRIHSSIKGTPMPAFGTSLSDQQIWDLVNYVMSMPYEDYSPGLGSDPPGTAELRALLPPPMDPAAEGETPAGDLPADTTDTTTDAAEPVEESQPDAAETTEAAPDTE